ncbi:MAG: T9SS type A sorting domain-containing protein [Bacteroidales bacterium]|jgi:hypothetical protein
MKARILFSLLLALIVSVAIAQQGTFHFPQQQIDALTKTAYLNQNTGNIMQLHATANTSNISGIRQIMKFQQSLKSSSLYNSLRVKNIRAIDTILLHDTLVVTDTVIITGSYTHNGPILVLNGGFLHFRHSTATILGDIYVFGSNSKLYADSSYLYIPQQYFYQRSLLAIDGGVIHYNNSTIDHSGLSHNVFIGSNSILELTNVHNNGFTTNGTASNAQFIINGTNQAGEYVITDSAQLSFRDANTVLLWHQFPDTAVINFTFPKGDTLNTYTFNKTITGVKGVEYSIALDTCTNVMWGLMPSTGSNVTINNSTIRSIGLWFTGSDTIAVNGLVDNSTYTTFTANLSDRHLQLNNCSVQTWSIYPMDKTHVNLSGCIVGEIGTEQTSSLNGTDFTCDGSGGYMWCTDTSLVFAGDCSAMCDVRGEGSGILVFAYSSQMNGVPMAVQSSVVMVIQSSVQQEPTFLDNSCAWYALIQEPFSAYADSAATVTGSAWIMKTATSTWMNFHSYELFYQLNSTTTWTQIITDSLHAKYDDTLGVWNTHGLTAGQYVLELVMHDSWGNTVTAMKSVNLMPKILVGINEQKDVSMNFFPNPITDKLNIVFNEVPGKNPSTRLFNEFGKEVYCCNNIDIVLGNSFIIDTRTLPAGVYLLNVSCNGITYNKKVVVIK